MKNSKKLFLDIHAIQTLPPSNINRDDTGSPKTAQYGGVRRARVSSQAWKKAMRTYFSENSENAKIGVRTLEIVKYVAKKIRTLDAGIDEEQAIKMADKVINAAGIKTKDEKAKALFFMAESQAIALAEAAVNGVEDKKVLQSLLNANPAIDIALFGRMVADDPTLNADASSQVAHSISTHSIRNEFDFYTAMDDLSEEDNAGAGMLGNIEFNSSTLYRYANIAVHELAKQLGDDVVVADTVKLFIKAFSDSLPSGKSNSFANQTLPQFVLVSLRSDRPVNLVSAFEKPVKSDDGYVEKSVSNLAKEFINVQKFTAEPICAMHVSVVDSDGFADQSEEKKSLDSLIDNCGGKILDLLSANED